MNPNFTTSYKEAAENERANTSPIEAALMNLHEMQERAERALAVLTDRLSSVLQPEADAEPGELVNVDKVGTPQSPVVRRLSAAGDDLRRLGRRIENLTDRLDA